MTNQEISPCPACGNDVFTPSTDKEVDVQCFDCHYVFKFYFRGKSEIIEAWNAFTKRIEERKNKDTQ